MKIDIQARNFNLTDSILTYTRERINFLLSSRFDQIQRISVRLSDVNGPKGGIDKRCQVRICLPRLKDIYIDDVQTDLYVAIFRATDRGSRTVNRRLRRLQDKKKRFYVPNKEKTELFINGQYVFP